MNKLLVCIFTYNRPKHLSNCISSLEHLLKVPFEICIYDDASSQIEQKTFLESLKSTYSIFVNTTKITSNSKVKGLYANMNNALDYAINRDFQYCLLLQDDTQMVRELSLEDFTAIEKALELESVFAVTSFFYKKNHPKDYKGLLDFDESVNCYIPKSINQHYLTGIADMGFFNVSKVKKVNWKFEDQEGKHIAKGREMGLVRAATKDPFFSFLPWPNTSRGGYGSIKKRLIQFLDWYYNTGFHPLRYMDNKALEKLKKRDLFDFPFAEDYLETKEEIELHTPWNFYDSFYPFKRKIKKLLKR